MMNIFMHYTLHTITHLKVVCTDDQQEVGFQEYGAAKEDDEDNDENPNLCVHEKSNKNQSHEKDNGNLNQVQHHQGNHEARFLLQRKYTYL